MYRSPHARCIRAPRYLAAIAAFMLPAAAYLASPGTAEAAIQCTDTITANVVVLDNPTVFNRLGAQNPNWITYALKRDVIDKASQLPCSQTNCTAGNVELRPDKRTRPLVVRSNDPDEPRAEVTLRVGSNRLFVGDEAPDFQLTGINTGEPHRLVDQRGSVVVLSYFATF